MSSCKDAQLYEKTWRTAPQWSEDEMEHIKGEIEDYVPMRDVVGSEVRFPQVNILFIGPVGSGKSSFFNTVNSVFRGKVFNQARSGSGINSITTKFIKYPVLSSITKQPLNFRLCDTRGLEAKLPMSKENLKLLLEGHLPNRFQVLHGGHDVAPNKGTGLLEFDVNIYNVINLYYKTKLEPSGSISSDTPGFIKYPNLEDQIHCVVFFIDATQVEAMPDLIPDVLQNLKDLQTVMNMIEIPQLVLLTKVDSVCKHVQTDISNVFRSPTVEHCVSKVAENLGLPRYAVLPMKNLENEVELNINVSILAMLNLRTILENADAFLFNKIDEIQEKYQKRD